MIQLIEGLNEVTLEVNSWLRQLPELPDVFYVETITAEPSIVTLGSDVKIHVTYWIPENVDGRLYVGYTYQAHCVIDGKTLTAQVGPVQFFPIDVDYVYTPQNVGIYTATALGKSISFEVRQKVAGVFYSPYGGYDSFGSIDALATYIYNNGLGQTSNCFQGNCVFTQHCPYCDYGLSTPNLPNPPLTVLNDVYSVLGHIQSSHPDYPLTAPRPHVEVIVPQQPSPVSSFISPGANCVVIDGACNELGYGCAYPPVLGRCFSWVFNNVGLFPTLPGKHRIQVTSFLRLGCWEYSKAVRWGSDPFTGAPLTFLFDQDITFNAVGDKVTVDAATGLTEYLPWRLPYGV